MNKYEWLWKSLKDHKQNLVDKFECQGKSVPIQHKATLEVMNFLEIREKEVNQPTKHADISIDELRGMSENL